jgi:uncharacterized protein
MAEITTHVPGSFCWFELATNDANSAKKFYSNLFGWQINDMPMGPDATYTMLEKDGKGVGALYGLDKEQEQRGVPPHWNLYVAVNNADEATKKAESLGATTVMAPFDVMDVGRMSIIQDPTGAMIMLWEAKRHTGAGVVDEPNAFCWYELNTNDTEKAKEFYTKQFGWETGGSPEYTEWKQGGKSIGGMMKIQPEWGPMPPNWMAYVMVNNADMTAGKATSLGGKVIMGPQDIPNMGRFAVISDPQGAVFAVYEPAKQA